ncbi:hypothetical protein EV191_101968 [Tamaricihabitans halophyticus]|uniref:Uncharacterized protein n=1 Tax=Tamaricihabitans halophyticus TaxID=1262583 RepID=A0A4V2SV38_9PSEU|nr:hypothetical protein [Tamaricihabitans halophyticus]TCP57016.1 hypothetical protein EV191_101968 [Tamaricihabitans halophyticus]
MSDDAAKSEAEDTAVADDTANSDTEMSDALAPSTGDESPDVTLDQEDPADATESPEEEPAESPAEPAEDPAEPADGAMRAPLPTRLAVVLGVLSPIVGLLVFVVAWLSIDNAQLVQVQAELVSNGEFVSRAELAEIVRTVMTVALSVAGALAIGWLVLLLLAYRGRNWARILLAGAGAAWVLLLVPVVFGALPTSTASTVLALLNILLVIGTVGVLFSPAATARFHR